MSAICEIIGNIPKRDVPVYSLFTVLIICCLVYGEWLAAFCLVVILVGIYHFRKWTMDGECCCRCRRDSSGTNTGYRSTDIPTHQQDRRQRPPISSVESNANTNSRPRNLQHPSRQHPSRVIQNSSSGHQNVSMGDSPPPYTSVSPGDLEDLSYYSTVFSVSGQIDSDTSPRAPPLPPDLLSSLGNPLQDPLTLSLGNPLDLPPSYSETVDTSPTYLTIGPPYQMPSTSNIKVDESKGISEVPPPPYSVASSNYYSLSSQPASISRSATNLTPEATTESPADIDERTNTGSPASSRGLQSQNISGAEEAMRDESLSSSSSVNFSSDDL